MDKIAKDFEDGKKVTYTRMGRRRLNVPDVPAALNTPIQAGALDVMKAISAEAYETKQDGWEIVGLVHDEILVLVPEEEAKAAKEWLHEVMVRRGGEVVNLGVPKDHQVTVGAGTQICDDWSEKE